MTGFLRVIVCCIAMFFVISKSYAAIPDWNINSADYEFSMTVTALLNLDGIVSSSEDDLVGAFVNGQCRGVVSPGKYLDNNGKALVFLQVYSNAILGEQVTFKLYSSALDKQYGAINILEFQNDKSYGTVSNPFIITTNNKPSDINISHFTVKENQSANTFIGIFSTTDLDASNSFVYSLIAGDGDSDNTSFIIRSDSLFTNGIFDVKGKNPLSILIQTDDQKGETFVKVFTIQISPDEAIFEASNYISPNGDGINDFWEIKNLELYTDFDVIICTAGGQVIYQTKTYQNNWNGVYNGKTLPTGVYYYIVRNNSLKFSGAITLVNE